MEKSESSSSKSPMTKIRPAPIKTRTINLTPTPGTIIHLPSGKTAIAHGSGLDKIQNDIEKSSTCKKSSSAKIISSTLSRPSRCKRPAKFLAFTLDEILEQYDKSLSQIN